MANYNRDCFLVFRNVVIPAEAVVDKAVIVFTATDNAWNTNDTVNARIED